MYKYIKQYENFDFNDNDFDEEEFEWEEEYVFDNKGKTWDVNKYDIGDWVKLKSRNNDRFVKVYIITGKEFNFYKLKELEPENPNKIRDRVVSKENDIVKI